MKISISVPNDIAARVDTLAAKLGKTRSWVYATAALQYAARYSELTAKLDRVYGPPISRPPTPFGRIMAKNIHKARGGHTW
jgi:hypothetical protein